jgi:23S rRNA pseudouridine1911/1915/1917 synthase
LDVFLASAIPDISRNRAQALVKEGRVVPSFPSKPVKSSQLVLEGQAFRVTLPPPEESHLEAQPLDLDVVFEDQHLLVVNKPVGLVVHPGAGNKDHTLLNALLAHCPDISGVGGVKKPGLVHRIDKDTSGLLVVAKTDLAYKSLVAQLRTRRLSREYLGIVKGLLEGKGTVEAAIGRHPRARKRMAVRPEDGKPARTHFRVLETGERASLLHLKLETGRTHQIRVHMAFIKHPILGDGVYGGGEEGVPRQMLHAFRLTLRHPKTGAPRSFLAPPPEDLLECLKANGLRRRAWGSLAWAKE